ncbi:MAG: lipopolysaccharide biosynthesis protein [Candidatus Angelobacter sp.]
MEIPLIFGKRRFHPFLTDVALTGAAQGSVLASNLVCVGIVGHLMGVVALGEFLLIRRLCAWLAAAAQLGLGTALPREIAHEGAEGEAKGRKFYLCAALIVTAAILLFSVICSGAPRWSANIMLGSGNVSLLYALLFLVLATVVHTMLVSYYVGLQQMRMANILQIVNNAALPAIVIWATARSQSTAVVVAAASLVQFVIACIWSIPVLLATKGIKLKDITDLSRQLLNYGIRRVPADIAAGGLFTVGPVIAAHYVSADKIAFLLLGTICLTSASIAFAPLSVVLLTKVSSLLGRGRNNDVRDYVGHLRSAVMHVSFLVVTQALLFVNPTIRWWIGGTYHSALPILCVMILGVPGYMYFVALRTVIDAATPVAYNTRNVVVSIAFLVTGSLAAARILPAEWLVMGVATTTTLAVCLLAFLTNRVLRQLEMGTVETSLRPFFVVAAPAMVGLAVQLSTGFNLGKIGFVLTLVFNAALLAVMIRKNQPGWLLLVGQRGLVRS